MLPWQSIIILETLKFDILLLVKHFYEKIIALYNKAQSTDLKKPMLKNKGV